MSIKKIAISAAAGALMLSMTVPAFANTNGNGNGGGFTLIKNSAWVKNVVVTKADTGDNSIHGKIVLGGKIKTGDAGAGAEVLNVVNSNDLGCGCEEDGVLIIKNKAGVKNVVITKADTGDNSIGGKVVLGGKIKTGDAGAGAVVTNIVNTNVVGDNGD